MYVFILTMASHEKKKRLLTACLAISVDAMVVAVSWRTKPLLLTVLSKRSCTVQVTPKDGLVGMYHCSTGYIEYATVITVLILSVV